MADSFSATDPASGECSTTTWLTPPWVFQALGEFDLDPCAHPAHNTARELIVWPDRCGLTEPWRGRVWLNPPYGRKMFYWLEKLQRHGNGIALVFARTDTSWFHNLNFEGVFFIQNRVWFLRPDGSKVGAPGSGSMLIPFGAKNVRAVRESVLKGTWLCRA